MFLIVRIFPTEERATNAARALHEAGYDEIALIANVPSGEVQAAVRDAVSSNRLPGSHIGICERSLGRGMAIVSVNAPFGTGEKATQLLESHGPIETPQLTSYRNPSPFSDALGIPVLANFSPMTDLSIIKYTFGEPKLRSRPSPLSSLFGLKTLSAFKKRSSMGLPLLSRNAAPLSSMFRMGTLRSFGRGRLRSFGLPLLSRNATPLSSLFGLRVLSKKEDEGRD